MALRGNFEGEITMTDIFTNNNHKYSEFYTVEPKHKHICTDSSCSPVPHGRRQKR